MQLSSSLSEPSPARLLERLAGALSLQLLCWCMLVLAAGALQPAGNKAECPVMLWPGTSAAVQAYPIVAAGSSLTSFPPACASAVESLLELRAQNLEVAIHGQVRPLWPPVRLCLQGLVLQSCSLARCGLLLSHCTTGSCCTSNVCSQAVQAVLPACLHSKTVPHFLALGPGNLPKAVLACIGLCLQLRAQLNMVATPSISAVCRLRVPRSLH